MVAVTTAQLSVYTVILSVIIAEGKDILHQFVAINHLNHILHPRGEILAINTLTVRMSHSTKWVEETQNVAGSPEELPIFALSDTISPLYAEVLLNGIPIRMEVDTGAAGARARARGMNVLFLVRG